MTPPTRLKTPVGFKVTGTEVSSRCVTVLPPLVVVTSISGL
jgi:hypothetical protein